MKEREQCITIAKKLAGAVKIPTVSYLDRDKIDYGKYEDFIAYLKEQFPLVHKKLKLDIVNEYSLLYRWELEGKNNGQKPIVLMAHYDVVPASEGGWKYSPFSGAMEEGQIWGRGTIDNKASLIGILEAVERLLSGGYEPSRNIYILSGHDEEISGFEGSKKVVEYLKNEGINIGTVIDEGFTILEKDVMPMFKRPMALIGIAEKGIVDVKVIVRGQKGHASMPSRSTAAGKLARAIVKIEDNPFPARITRVIEKFLRYMAKEVRGITGFIIGHPYLFAPIIKSNFSKSGTSDAMIRTTQAVTMLKGSDKENVLPGEASATINIRILPGESISSVVERYEKLLKGMDVEIKLFDGFPGSEPVPESDIESKDYATMKEVVGKVFPDVGVAPFLVLATTDSRHFRNNADNIFRFVPLRMTREKTETIHGKNERIGIEEFCKLVDFYIELIREMAG